MAGTVVATVTEVAGSGGVTKYSLAWTSDASGDVSANSVTVKAGTLVGVAYTPGSGGSQPSAAYDVTMTCDDHTGTDVLGGTGANLSNSSATHALPLAGTYHRQWLHGGGLTLVVAAAGNAKSGTVDLYVMSGVA